MDTNNLSVRVEYRMLFLIKMLSGVNFQEEFTANLQKISARDLLVFGIYCKFAANSEYDG